MGIDAHAFKASLVGELGDQYDISKTKDGSIFLTPVRRGNETIPTNYYIGDLPGAFPLEP